MDDMEQLKKIDSAKVLLQALMTLFLGCIVAMNGWAISRLLDIDKQQAVNTKWIEAFTSEGPRFTADDYSRESSILLRLIDDIDSDMTDLQVRVRDLELRRHE